MEFMVILFLAAFAMGSAQECTEERAEVCVESLLSAILGDTTEEEVCRELKTSIDCLRKAVDDCVEGTDDEVEEGLAELEKVLKDNCGSDDDEDEKMKKCFETNEDYIFECIYEGSAQALALLIEQSDELDENALQCTMYSMMTNCFVERIEEKCGQKAAELAKTELEDLPTEIAQACEAAGDIQSHSFELLDKKKKK